MSLLNKALREAEERQRRPDVAAAYTGAVYEGRGGNRRIIVLIVLLALGLTGGGIYWFAMMNSASTEIAEGSELEAGEQGRVERPAVVSEDIAEPQPPVETPEPASEVVQSEVLASEVVESEAVESAAPAPQTTEVAETAIPNQPRAEKDLPEAAAPEPEPKQEPNAPAPGNRTAEAAQPQPEPQETAVVKTAPQSPGAIDRQTAKELETLIASGRMLEAERRLASLTQTQAAPRSRFAVARALLVDGEISRALSWLPEALAADDSTLRMLRARAQHAEGRLTAAIATLESGVPAVSEQPEYRVTLATLLQQQGRGREAAAHWAELIAWDDSRAPWWVGLAIALEDQGETRGAARAYEQAAALPGLPPSLVDYVQRRLQSLRAG